MILAFSAASREGVDELAEAALASGGSDANEPIDYGFMYSRSFQDPDGHIWEVLWMDEAAAQQEAARPARPRRGQAPAYSSGSPKRGKTVSTSRKNVSSTIFPSSISTTCNAHGS